MGDAIIGSPNQNLLAVNNSGAVPVAGYSGGTIYPLLVDSNGWLLTSQGASGLANIMGLYDSTKPTRVVDGATAQILVDEWGRPLLGVEPERFQNTILTDDASSATQVKAKTANKQMHILSMAASTDTELDLTFQDDTGTPVVLMNKMFFSANGGFMKSFPPQAPLVVGTNKDFDVLASVAGSVSVTITGYLASGA